MDFTLGPQFQPLAKQEERSDTSIWLCQPPDIPFMGSTVNNEQNPSLAYPQITSS